MPKYCIQCGKEILDDHNVCQDCQSKSSSENIKEERGKSIKMEFCAKCGAKRAGRQVLCLDCGHYFEDIIQGAETRKNVQNKILEGVTQVTETNENVQTIIIEKPIKLEKKRKKNKKIAVPLLSAIFVIIIVIIGINISGIPVFNSQINKIRFVHNWNIQAQENANGITSGKRIKRSDLKGNLSDEIALNADFKIQINYADSGSRIESVNLFYMGTLSGLANETSLPNTQELLKILDFKEDSDIKISAKVYNAINKTNDNFYEEAKEISILLLISNSKRNTYDIFQNVVINYEKLLNGTWQRKHSVDVMAKNGSAVKGDFNYSMTFKEDSTFTIKAVYYGYVNNTRFDGTTVYTYGKFSVLNSHLIRLYDFDEDSIEELGFDEINWDFTFINKDEIFIIVNNNSKTEEFYYYRG